MTPVDSSVLLVGCGKMGGALLEAWLREPYRRFRVTVVEPSALRPSENFDKPYQVTPRVREESGIPPPAGGRIGGGQDSVDAKTRQPLPHHAPSPSLPLRGRGSPQRLKRDGYTHVPSLQDVRDIEPDVVVFAVKPQSLDGVLPDYASRFGVRPLYVSIAAGKPLSYYREMLGAGARIVRAMPNMPASLCAAMTALVASENAREEDRSVASALMEAAGMILWLDDESKMDVVTAISGSGPAYMFYFVECLVDIARAHGIAEVDARRMALQTMYGSSALGLVSPEPLAALRQSIASPGGTTEAALDILMGQNGLRPVLFETVSAAIERSKTLSRPAKL